jgi:thiol-disulfide isomerase/thioredoxin
MKDLAGAKEEINLEKDLYPQNWRAELDYLGMLSRQDQTPEGKATLKLEVKKYAEAFKDNDDAVPSISSWLKTVGDTAGSQAVEKAALARNPEGEFARQSRWSSRLMGEKDPAKRAALIKQYLNDNPHLDKNEARLMMVSIYTSYQQAKDYDQAAEELSKIENPSWQWYNELAWGLIEKGENLEKATAWAGKGVELSRHPDPDEKRFYTTLSEWENGCRYNTGAILDTYAYGLFQLAKYDEAERSSAEAFDLTRGDDADISQRYIECMIANKHFDKAFDIGMQCFKRGKSNDKMAEMVKRAYAMKEGEAGGFDKLSAAKQKNYDETLTQANQSRIDKLRKDVAASRVNKQSVDFTLNNLDGKPVSLSSLKGKVVVIDFWATWCGPCKASFPYLQKVYDKYKDNQKVAFLAVDTWERVKGLPATIENAKKFLTDNKYTFPVLIDEISGTKLSDKYEVTGIPTKFIVDKKGDVAFVSVGFMGPDMEQELTAQIELLLGDTM